MKTRFFWLILLGRMAIAQAQIEITPATLYQDIAEKGYETQEVVSRIAHYHYANQIYPRAYPWYEKLVNSIIYQNSPIDYYEYGKVLEAIGKKSEAEKQYASFTKESIAFFNKLLQEKKITKAKISPNNEIMGLLSDAETGQVLSNAKVVLVDITMKTVLTDESDLNGFFILPNKKIPADFQYGYIEITKQGYEVATLPIVMEGGNQQKYLVLHPHTIVVEEGDNLATPFAIDNIHFDYGRTNIRYDASVQLAKIVAFLEANPSVSLDIKVHSDSRGGEEYNMNQTEIHAQSIGNWLIGKGISPKRITFKGYGETQLVNGCTEGVPCEEEEHQANKRVEFILR